MSGVIKVPLAGPRELLVPWPDASVPVGPYTALPAPAPVTVHYESGPVPWIDLRKTNVDPPIRLYLGHTLPVPDDGVGWEVRPAFSAQSVSLDRPAGIPPASFVQHNCVLRLDVPVDHRSAGILSMDIVATVDFADAEVQILRVPAAGIRRIDILARSSATWPGTLTATMQSRLQAETALGVIRWFQDASFGAGLFNAANTRGRGLIGQIDFTSVAAWNSTNYAEGVDFWGLLLDGGGTAGQDTLDIQIRGSVL